MGSRKKKKETKSIIVMLYAQLSIHERIALKHYMKWWGRSRYHLQEILAGKTPVQSANTMANAIHSGMDISNLQSPF
jgi:hypothetical protein